MDSISSTAEPSSAAPAPKDRWIFLFAVPILLIGVVTGWLFREFTVEDAYITAHYAENLVDTGQFVFNLGERVSAMTSPLHALLEAGLYWATGHTMSSYKLVALISYLVSVVLVCRRYKSEPYACVVCLTVLVAAPCMWEWTIGGLETPLLMLLVTLTTILGLSPEKISASRLCTIALLSGCAFLTRFDSVIYFLPFALYVASKSRSPKAILLGVVCGAILPAAWLAFSQSYYGDIFPTSAYVKAPRGGTYYLKVNAVYIVQYLTFVGILPLGLVLFLASAQRSHWIQQYLPTLRATWGIWLGILLLLGYGLLTATTHMMFAFRYFVPYMPAAAILLGELYRRQVELLSQENKLHRLRWAFCIFIPAILALSVIQVQHTYLNSVDGLVFNIGEHKIGDYKHEGLQQYTHSFMATLEKQARDIEKHWKSLPISQQRPMRLRTYIGGIVPYMLRDAYIYEILISYRHQGRYNLRLSADYNQVMEPRGGLAKEELPKRFEDYKLISKYRVMFDGVWETFLVYYDPHPEPNRLPSRIDGTGAPVDP